MLYISHLHLSPSLNPAPPNIAVILITAVLVALLALVVVMIFFEAHASSLFIVAPSRRSGTASEPPEPAFDSRLLPLIFYLFCTEVGLGRIGLYSVEV